MFKILIIDDENTILNLFSFVFQDANFETKTANSGEMALELIENYKPDFMIVDISMPLMNGWEFIKNLNEKSLRKPEFKNIPYVVMTGEDFLAENKKFSFEKDKNFKKYFVKMTDPDIILNFVKETLNVK